MMGTVIDQRRRFSDERFQGLREKLSGASGICEGNSCVYATGSFGRREASAHSDLDLFIVSLCAEDGWPERSCLSKLDEILLKAELIRASRELQFPPFSKDGRFLQHHTAMKLIRSTGSQNDDAENTFTARLLLLLESRPLVGEDIHSRVIEDVIAKYWREFSDHFDSFIPAFLANDILRYWRTMCLNYEATTIDLGPDSPSPRDRAKRKIKNYKLKHSRMLTCYSALLYLLFVHSRCSTVSIPDVRHMVSLTPTERVQFVGGQLAGRDPAEHIDSFLERYERFLEATNASEDEVIEAFLEKQKSHQLRGEQSEFGDLAYKILCSIGQDNEFYRRLVI